MGLNKFGNRYNHIDWDKIKEEYLIGKSIKQISKELKCSRHTIKRHLIKIKIEIRNPKNAGKFYSGEKSKCWKGGKFIDHDGKVWLTIEGTGRILEAHYVWLQHQPNDSLKGFDIHHIDGNNQNNKISNLQKVTRSEHRKIHQSPTQNWDKYAAEYKNGKSCADIAYELKCSRQCVWKNIKDKNGKNTKN